jgi:3-methylcrotonyl-CoA carboxylase alpha subunit
VAGLSVDSLGDGWYIVSDGVRRWRVAVASGGADRWVFVDGLVAQLTGARQEGVRRRSKSATETGLTAPMPATVVAIHVAVGQRVKAGDPLIVLEAMKMELPLRSPREGVIKSIHCVKGELVQPGVNLLEFE